MIRILQVIGKMQMGGAETILMNLYRNINRERVQFDFMVHTEEECIFDKEILTLGGMIYRVPKFNGMNFTEYIRAWNAFFEEHKEHKIVHGHIGSSAAIYLDIAKKHGCYTIAHSHSIAKDKKGLREIVWNMYSYPTRYVADFFFGCSLGAGIDRYGEKVVNSNHFAVLNNGIDSQEYVFKTDVRRRIRAEFNISEGGFVVGHIGRIDPPKNHFFLLDVFARIKAYERNAVLMLVGTGSLKGKLTDRVKEYGLSEDVIMTGVRNDVPELLNAMDVFLFPSIFEGLGIAAIEAQASGLHTICSDVIPKEAQVTELLEYVSLDDGVDVWAKKALQYNNHYERKDMSFQIKQNNYDIRKIAQDIQLFYETHWRD